MPGEGNEPVTIAASIVMVHPIDVDSTTNPPNPITTLP